MSLLSLLFGNYSNNKATNAANDANKEAMGTIDGYYKDAKGYMSPYMQTGTMANSGLQQLLGGDYSGFYDSPDYKAAMQSGGDMLDNSAAARGMLFSGAHQKDLSNFGQQMATQYLGNHRNFLSGLQGNGQQAAMGLGALGMGAGNSIAGLQQDMGKNRASNYAQRGQNFQGFENSLFGSFFGGG